MPSTSTRDYQSERFAEYRLDLNDPRYRKFTWLLRNRTPGAALEIGCSAGEYLEVLREKGWQVEGIEVSESAAGRGIARGLSIRVADATERLPHDSGRFDVVIAGEIIEHTFDDLAFLRECHRALRPGGTLILSTPNLTSLKNRVLMLLGFNPRFALADYHYRVYTIHVLRSLLRRSPFRRCRILGSYVLYSRNRERFLGGLLEWLGNVCPYWAEHFIVVAEKASVD